MKSYDTLSNNQHIPCIEELEDWEILGIAELCLRVHNDRVKPKSQFDTIKELNNDTRKKQKKAEEKLKKIGVKI